MFLLNFSFSKFSPFECATKATSIRTDNNFIFRQFSELVSMDFFWGKFNERILCFSKVTKLNFPLALTDNTKPNIDRQCATLNLLLTIRCLLTWLLSIRAIVVIVQSFVRCHTIGNAAKVPAKVMPMRYIEYDGPSQGKNHQIFVYR